MKPMKNMKHSFIFINNYLNKARYEDAPDWLANKKFMCIECGSQPIYLKEENCPYPGCDCMIPTDVSLNIGISLLNYLNKYARDKKAYITNNPKPNYSKPINVDDLLNRDGAIYGKEGLIDAIKKALPMVEYTDNPDLLPKMYRTTKDEYVIDNELCDRLIDFYINEHNKGTIPQYICKIEVRKLFGYHSYDINMTNKLLSILYGSNGLGKTTVFKLLEFVFIKPFNNNSLFDNSDVDVKEALNYIIKLPFEMIRVFFIDGYYVSLSKANNILTFDYVSNGFDSIMPVEINLEEINKMDENNQIEKFKFAINTHYKNIEKLFPNINNKNRFLFVKVNRVDNVNLFKKKIIDYVSSLSVDKLHDKEQLERDFEKMTLPPFYSDFMEKLQDVVYNFNNSVSFNIKIENFHGDKPFDFKSSEILNYISKNYESIVNLNYDDKVISTLNPKAIKDFELEKESLSKRLSELYKNMTIDFKNYFKIREEMIGLIFKSWYRGKFGTKNIIDLCKNLSLFKHFFESIYYEKDPSRKKIVFKDGALRLKVNSSLNDDFSKYLYFDSLSSGEINIATILYNLIFNTAYGTIVLIDEPEVSLHMAWQKQFADIVKEIMKVKRGMQVIIASHSPFLTSGDDDLFVGVDLLDEESD